ncbi:MAG: thioredoxin domain-containing protein [Succinivibrionaceae bacterium]|nr:thioredoxin domain-containing protein [Succinivibrionaceae bacterium]
MIRYLLLLSALTVAAFQVALLAMQLALIEHVDEMGARLGQIQSSGEKIRMEGVSARQGGKALVQVEKGAEQGSSGQKDRLTSASMDEGQMPEKGLKAGSQTEPGEQVSARGGFTRGAGLQDLPLMAVRDGGELSRDDFAAAPLVSAEHLYGAGDARFRLYLFTDFSCPFCQRLFRPMLKLIEENPRELSLEFRHFPLEQHGPQTLLRAVLAECAAVTGGNRSFWQAADRLFVSADYTRLARSISVSEHRISACAQDPAMVQRIREDVLEGKALGISSTPAVVVLDRLTNTRLILTGISGTEQIRQAIGRMLIESERRQEGMHFETLQSHETGSEDRNEKESGKKDSLK